MPLTMRPTGLGAGIDKDRPDYTVYSGDGRSAGSTRPVAARQSALVLVANRQRSDDALGPRSAVRRGQGALSEELRRWKAWAKVRGDSG